MRTLLVLIGLLILSGCGKPNYEKDIKDIVSNFESTYNVSVGLPITFVEDMPDNAVGMAYGTSRIELLRSYWDTQSDEGKEQILYHELGHAFFSLGHNSGTVPYIGSYNRPVSIMNPVAFGEEYFYKKFRDEYKAELYSEWKARGLTRGLRKEIVVCNGKDIQ